MAGAASRSTSVYGGMACPRCAAALTDTVFVSDLQRCPSCRGEFEATRFEPPPAGLAVARVPEAGPEGATACPGHPGNAAVAHCGRCGILICGLCRIQADDMVLCPPCFERLSEEGVLPSTRIAFRDYSRMASTVAVVGALTCYFGMVAGPVAIYCAFKGRGQRLAMGEPASLWALAVVVLVAIGQMVGSGWLLAVIVGAFASKTP
jgi:hypothetical protein